MKQTAITVACLLLSVLHASSRQPAPVTPADSIRHIIETAGKETSFKELTTIVHYCTKEHSRSETIAIALTGWLREDHPIYTGRLPTEVIQFRGYLLAAMAHFPTNDELYKYVKSELVFGGHAFSVAAAARTAGAFMDSAARLTPLLEAYLHPAFIDKAVDISTPELNYPLINPTNVREEVKRTLGIYRAMATSATKPATKRSCCQDDSPMEGTITVVEKKQRKAMALEQLPLVDQEGRACKLTEAKNKPFVLTFFYTRCANPLKCAATVSRLGELEKECLSNKLTKKIGIYGMTYDPDFDTPPILKEFGTMYGVKFEPTTKFISVTNQLNASVVEELRLRVNYGAGSVNQHGIQLFVFDKKGRLAGWCDNDLWEVADVSNLLARLAKE